MQWPGVIPAGTVSDAPAVHFDLFATILDAAGVKAPEKNGDYPLHGVSLLPHVRSGGKTPLPDRYLFWDLYGDCAALHGPWKIVGQIANHHGKFGKAAAEAEKTKFALYNVDQDIAEKTDVSAEHPDIYNDLKTRHLQWLKSFASANEDKQPDPTDTPKTGKKKRGKKKTAAE
jgi:arylsulfatase A-like enzyme